MHEEPTSGDVTRAALIKIASSPAEALLTWTRENNLALLATLFGAMAEGLLKQPTISGATAGYIVTISALIDELAKQPDAGIAMVNFRERLNGDVRETLSHLLAEVRGDAARSRH